MTLESIEVLSRNLHGKPDAFVQLLLALCGTRTLNRIIHCPTYPVMVNTRDLPRTLQDFKDSQKNKYDTPRILAELFTKISDVSRRKVRGQYFTPEPSAELAAQSLQLRNLETVVDAGCGTGVFAASLLKELREDSLTRTYLGIESDPILALCAAVSLDQMDAPPAWKVLYANYLLLDREYLKKIGYSEIDAIISNPPFVRSHKIQGKKSLIVRLRQRTGISLTGYSGLHSFFLAHSTSLLKPKGRMTFIFPLEMSGVNHGSGLLDQIKSRFEYHTEGLPYDLLLFNFIPRQKMIHQLPANHSFAVKRTFPLESLAEVHRGISTGCNAFFAMTDKTTKEWNIPRKFLRTIVPPKIGFSGNIFDEQMWNRLRLLGKPCWLLSLPKEISVEMMPNSLREYIRFGLRNEINLLATCRLREPWYSVPVTYVPDLLFTYMSRGQPQFIYNQARAYILTNLLGIRIVESTHLRKATMVDLARVLTQDLAKWIKIDSVGRRYAGGLIKFEPGDLKKMPVSEDVTKMVNATSSSLMGYA